MAKSSKVKRIGAALCVIALIVLVPYLFKTANRFYADYSTHQAAVPYYDKMIAACLDERVTYDAGTTTLELMNCIHTHSQHGVNDAYYALAATGEDGIAKRLFSQIDNPDQELPTMECSMRAKLLNQLLDRLDIENWHVVITQKGQQNANRALWDHVVIEIVNPATERPELYDPTYNSYYEDKETGRRLNAEDLLSLPKERIRICIADETTCTDEYSPEAQKAIDQVWDYFGIAYRNAYKEPEFLRGPLLVNPERFDVDTVYAFGGKPMTFCEKEEEQCAAKRILISSSGSSNSDAPDAPDKLAR